MAPYVVGKGVAAAMGYDGTIATGKYDEWTGLFHDFAESTTLWGAYSATKTWWLAQPQHPPHQDYPDGYWGYSAAQFFGSHDERLQIAEP
ncbi:MAG: hypothetical protein KBI47_22255 [Armatimonadetes bacterium]|nr:hypothetical protein [Armatimonadota bacterium]